MCFFTVLNASFTHRLFPHPVTGMTILIALFRVKGLNFFCITPRFFSHKSRTPAQDNPPGVLFNFFTVPILPPKPCHGVTFCRFSQKYFIRFVFFLSSTGDNLSPLHRPNSRPRRQSSAPRRLTAAPRRSTQPHRSPVKDQPSPHRINPGSTISTPTFSALPERKCQKKLHTYPTFALPNPHSPRARAQYLRARAGTRGNIRAARSGCARPRRRVYNIAAWLASCCRAGGLLPGLRPASGLSGCCWAGGLLLGWRAAAGLAGCCRAGVLLPGRPGWRSGPILCSLCKLHSRTP